MYRLMPLFLLALVVSAAWGAARISAQAAGVTVTYAAGWNLVAFPPGTDLSGVAGPLYVYQPSDESYVSVLPAAGLPSNTGAWVYFTTPTTVVLGTGSAAPISVGLIPQQWALLGDPSGIAAAIIKGGPIAYTYDPLNGYQPVQALLPGRGVWVTPMQGSHTAITIAPLADAGQALTSLSFTSPCGAALGARGYTGEGNGQAVGEVDGQPVALCFANGPVVLLPAVQGYACLLVGGTLATLDGAPACSGLIDVVPQGANQFLWISHLSAAAEAIEVIVWDGHSSQFHSRPVYIACAGSPTIPVASADQCSRQQ